MSGGPSPASCGLACDNARHVRVIPGAAKCCQRDSGQITEGLWYLHILMHSEYLLFLLQTVGFDPIVSKEEAAAFDVEKMELEQIWPIADYITVHTPLIPQTRSKSKSSSQWRIGGEGGVAG